MLISPSVLNSDLARLAEEIARVDSVADLIHLDVMDNHFVPNLTFGLPVVKSVIENTDLRADIHLMISNVDQWAPSYAEAGAFSVTFHIEASSQPAATARAIRSHGARSAVAFKPGTNLEALPDLVDDIDMALIMTVEPGFGGQAFMHNMLEKVRQAREIGGADLWIEVDGGVSSDTIIACRDAGANVFVAGSSVYSSTNPAEKVQELKDLLRG